jgi:hypothetical protein
MDISFEDALEVIYETIGCVSVAKKPVLSYKLSSAPQKANPIMLGSETDWEGCLEEVAAAQAKKKGVAVPVNIIVTAQVCPLFPAMFCT